MGKTKERGESPCAAICMTFRPLKADVLLGKFWGRTEIVGHSQVSTETIKFCEDFLVKFEKIQKGRENYKVALVGCEVDSCVTFGGPLVDEG